MNIINLIIRSKKKILLNLVTALTLANTAGTYFEIHGSWYHQKEQIRETIENALERFQETITPYRKQLLITSALLTTTALGIIIYRQLRSTQSTQATTTQETIPQPPDQDTQESIPEAPNLNLSYNYQSSDQLRINPGLKPNKNKEQTKKNQEEQKKDSLLNKQEIEKNQKPEQPLNEFQKELKEKVELQKKNNHNSQNIPDTSSQQKKDTKKKSAQTNTTQQQNNNNSPCVHDKSQKKHDTYPTKNPQEHQHHKNLPPKPAIKKEEQPKNNASPNNQNNSKSIINKNSLHSPTESLEDLIKNGAAKHNARVAKKTPRITILLAKKQTEKNINPDITAQIVNNIKARRNAINGYSSEEDSEEEIYN